MSARIRIVALMVALLSVLLAPVANAAADGGAAQDFLNRLNAERSANGLHTLQSRSDLVGVGQNWTAKMADSSKLSHNPNLANEVQNWQVVGENVGRGPTVAVIHDAFMNSSSHRSNVLHERYTEVGVAVDNRDGYLWVTFVFRLPENAQPPAQPAPEPEPAQEPAPEPAPEPAAEPAPAAPSAQPAPPAPAAPAPAATPTSSPAPANLVAAAADTASEAIVPPPPHTDRATMVLARLEAGQQEMAVSDVLGSDW